ncbi:MAG TPA: HAMP domain-containing protein, partial [Caulobacteraceae bacterium]
MKFDDLKLRTKTLIPLIGMAAVFASVIAGGTLKMNDLTRRYGQITTSVDPAIVQLMRTTRTANELGRDVYAALVYDAADVRAKKASADFDTAQARGDKSLDEAARLNPAAADQYRAFKDRYDRLYEEAKAPKAISDTIPGLAMGSKLAVKDLDQMAVAARQMEQLDADINDFCRPVLDFNHKLEADNDKAVEELKRESQQTITMMVGLGLLSIVTGLGVSIWIANGKVAGPLVRLGERMKRLASGELSVQIEGQERGDEVGDMAKAVQVFKDNALKTQAMEAEARTLR